MGLPNTPGFFIMKLKRAMSAEIDRRLKAYDVTLSQWMLLKQLWQQEGRSQVELQELLGLEAATVTGLIQRMLQQGLVQRQPDPVDRRVQRVFLTERGRSLQQLTATLEQELNDLLLQGFTDDERIFFLSLLARAQQNICNVSSN